MSYKPFSIDGVLGDTTVQTVRAASNAGTPSNERIVIKRLRVTHVGADASANCSFDLWKGPTRNDANREARTVTLSPGQVKEWDPTFMILEPGETLWFQTSVASLLSISGDGAIQNE